MKNIWRKAIRRLCAKHFFDFLPDKQYLKLYYWAGMGKKLNLDSPQTYNEKLQWLKLYDRKPIYTTMVDKYEVKEFVENIIGKKYIIPTLGVWDNFEEIDFSLLPDQFVLKTTHDSGGVVICKNKKTFDVSLARKKLNKSLKTNFFYFGREWPYKNVKRRIIAEDYMEDTSTSELRDYKIFCFNGEAKLLFVATDRQSSGVETKFDFFDMNFCHLPFTNGHPNAKIPPEKPQELDLMKELAQKLSKNVPHLRVDFYEVNGKVYFGELTFFHWSGNVPFEPESWDLKLGEWIHLPEIKSEM